MCSQPGRAPLVTGVNAPLRHVFTLTPHAYSTPEASSDMKLHWGQPTFRTWLSTVLLHNVENLHGCDSSRCDFTTLALGKNADARSFVEMTALARRCCVALRLTVPSRSGTFAVRTTHFSPPVDNFVHTRWTRSTRYPQPLWITRSGGTNRPPQDFPRKSRVSPSKPEFAARSDRRYPQELSPPVGKLHTRSSMIRRTRRTLEMA